MPDEKKQAGRNLQQPIGIVKFVTKHALERWMERTENSSRAIALASLKKHAAQATEVELTPEFQVIALLNRFREGVDPLVFYQR